MKELDCYMKRPDSKHAMKAKDLRMKMESDLRHAFAKAFAKRVRLALSRLK